MQTNSKPLSYSNLTSTKLLFPLLYRESVSTPKNFCSSVRTTKRLDKRVSRLNFLMDDLKYFRLSKKPIKKGSTQNTIINPVRNGQISDYSFANFLFRSKDKKNMKIWCFDTYKKFKLRLYNHT